MSFNENQIFHNLDILAKVAVHRKGAKEGTVTDSIMKRCNESLRQSIYIINLIRIDGGIN